MAYLRGATPPPILPSLLMSLCSLSSSLVAHLPPSLPPCAAVSPSILLSSSSLSRFLPPSPKFILSYSLFSTITPPPPPHLLPTQSPFFNLYFHLTFNPTLTSVHSTITPSVHLSPASISSRCAPPRSPPPRPLGPLIFIPPNPTFHHRSAAFPNLLPPPPTSSHLLPPPLCVFLICRTFPMNFEETG